jgi:anti-sigma28 factor (negative regulator of flagellin synthesis)
MHNPRFNFPLKNSLIKPEKAPIAKGRTMQINSATTSQVFPVTRTASSQAQSSAPEATDTAELNTSADSFSGMVRDASAMPEVRSEVVDAYKARINAGSYPSQETIVALADAIGGAVVHAARTGSLDS